MQNLACKTREYARASAQVNSLSLSTVFRYDNSGQKLIEDWQYSYHFDLNGNLVSKLSTDITKDSFNYSYSSKNQLIEVVQFGGYIFGSAKKRTVYFYDVLGRRMQKSVEDFTSRDENNKVVINSTAQRVFSRKYLYDGDNILAEYDGNNVALARYTHSPLRPDDILSAEITSSGVTAGLAQSAGKVYYLKDALGTVTDVVNASGSVVQRYEYESFGKIVGIRSGSGVDITSSPVVNTSFTFTGREWDEDAGLYYYRARYYDPSTARFLQQDPDPGYLELPSSVLNKYSYARNNPIIANDPSGRFAPLIWLAIAVGSAVAAQNVNFAMKSGEWDIAKLLGTAINGFAYGFFSTTLTAGTGFWATVGISAGLGAAHNAINQTLFTGSVKDWDSVGYSGVAGGLGAGFGYGVAKGVAGVTSSGWEILGQPIGNAKELFNFPAGAAGALGGLFYNTTITSEDNGGIPKCMQINTMCGKIGE